MGVFLYQFLDDKWEGTAVEPDSKACRHLKRVMPTISVINGEIKDLKIEKFNLITLNRVLEHVYNPAALLCDLLNYSNQDTIIYLELPDVLSFYKDGPNIKNITCYSNEENKWRKSKINFVNDNELKILLEGKFTTERGRINCSLRDKSGKWRWLGIQYVIAEY